MIPHIYHRAPSTARVDDGSAPITTSLGRRPKRAAPFPQCGWLEKLLATLYKVDIGIISPCISVAGNTDVKGFGLTIINRDFLVRWLGKQADEPYEVPLVGGGCMTMKKSFFEAIGRFDTMRTFGVEDVELCIRCWLFGYPVIVVPNAEVAHWFKEKSNFYVGWQDYVYNLLRTAILHFDGESLARILDYLQTKPSFREAIESLLLSNIWERYGFVRAKQKHNAEWFYQRFAIEI